MPQKKKDSSVRRRANKASTASTLRRVEEDTTSVEILEAMTVVQLREAIDIRNQSRPADQQIPKKGAKALLVSLLAAAERSIPDLPRHPPRWSGEGKDSFEVQVDWDPQTEAWWNDVWTSPMALEWDVSDLHNVVVVALLYDDIWAARTAKERKEALSEYRLQRADLGLSPYSRRRLEWTIETADEAKSRGEKRRGNGRVSEPKRTGAARPDPRVHLTSVPS